MSEFPPSERRRREARARGEVAVSPLATAAGALTGGALAIGFGAREAGAALASFARRAFTGELPVAGALGEAATLVARVALPVAVAAWLGAVAVGLVQSRGLFTLGVFRRADRPTARTNARRETSRAMPWALAASLVLLAILGSRAIGGALARAHGIEGATAAVLDALGGLLPRALLLVAAAGLGDWAWRRIRLERALWMSRADRAREQRDAEADPRLRAEQRRRHRDVMEPPKT